MMIETPDAGADTRSAPAAFVILAPQVEDLEILVVPDGAPPLAAASRRRLQRQRRERRLRCDAQKEWVLDDPRLVLLRRLAARERRPGAVPDGSGA